MKRGLEMFEKLFGRTLHDRRVGPDGHVRRRAAVWLAVSALLGGALTALPAPLDDSPSGARAGGPERGTVETARKGAVPSPQNLVPGQWTWVGGSDSVNQTSMFGKQGVPAPANAPGARTGASSWTDAAGNLWLFGGIGFWRVSNSYFSDLWKFDVSIGQWTWVSGSNVSNQPATFGSLGVPAPGNTPGARTSSVAWTDTRGNLWLLGGLAYAPGGAEIKNDLWKYNIASGMWTWVSGSNRSNQSGVYGTNGTEAPGNAPGARYGSVSWIDTGGYLWLFGGFGNAAVGSGELNDLWRFNTSSGQWGWIGGSNQPNKAGTYGTKGVAAPGNVPGARDSAVSWIDASGNLWLFGGYGYASTGIGDLNDLWMYDVGAGRWIWSGGWISVNSPGTYSVQGSTDTAIGPGARRDAVSWKDPNGKFWLFGGFGYGATNASGDLNDLWKLDPPNGVWTWAGGTKDVNRGGRYGTRGSSDAANLPGTRYGSSSWADAMGNLWLFGGYGYSTFVDGYLNCFWTYANPAGSSTCSPDSTNLCLLGGRFKVAVDYANYGGDHGQGKAVALTPDAGYFWFSGSSNVEVVAKMVSFCGDGSNNVSVYTTGLTDLDVTVHVTDTRTGTAKDYHNPLGTGFSLIRDGPFGCPTGVTPPLENLTARAAPDRIVETTSWAPPAPAAGEACVPDQATLCLLNNRFQIRAAYAQYGGKTGTGQAVTLTSDTGTFWFFDSKNVEVVAKMVSFCGGGSNNVGIYSGGLTDLQVELTVTDTLIGLTKTYSNPLGTPFQLIRDGPFTCP